MPENPKIDQNIGNFPAMYFLEVTGSQTFWINILFHILCPLSGRDSINPGIPHKSSIIISVLNKMQAPFPIRENSDPLGSGGLTKFTFSGKAGRRTQLS